MPLVPIQSRMHLHPSADDVQWVGGALGKQSGEGSGRQPGTGGHQTGTAGLQREHPSRLEGLVCHEAQAGVGHDP
eukprot:CAMPEP_0179137016 /NCGR_PEP_ID=MMETSP0796-20121207/65332_1 /TAXON_ID=73915 /ORGANISM="Pyrodinium bahamense, Strain pbaha01" /LENGTH=74 /DNA_ID=CAMNT_0020836153 /DNA_START=148 /DNA_END=372 /DNA_ORIENTATION=-